MRYLSTICAVALSFAIISCSGSRFASIPELQEQFSLPAIPAADQYPEDDAVVLIEDTDYQTSIVDGSSLETNITIHRVEKLFRNIDEHASIEIPISYDEKLIAISARTIRTDGSIIDLKPEEFHMISGNGEDGVFYSDTKSMRFTFPAVEKGCIVEFKYTIYSPYAFITNEWDIQGSLPVLRNRYSLTIPTLLLQKEVYGGAGWEWRYRTYNYANIGQPEIVKYALATSRYDKKVTFRWMLSDIPPLRREPSMPPSRDFLSYVKFAMSEWETWDDVAEWYWKRHFGPQFEITSSVREKAADLTSACGNDEAKIAAIYSFVQKLRYVAIEIGEGGFKPSPPEIVMEREYGDCKDKAILLLSLLRAVGITSNPVLIETANIGELDEQFPNWRFNHMIVRAESAAGKVYFLDGTAEYCRPGELPWPCEGRTVLVLNDDATGHLEKTPASAFTENATNIDIHGTIQTSGRSTFTVDLSFAGEDDDYYRWRFADKADKDVKEICKSFIIDDFVNATITNFKVSPVDSLNKPLAVQFSFQVENALQKQGDLYFATIDPFRMLTDMGWLIKETRKYPLTFHYPSTVKKNIDIIVSDSSYAIRSLPENGMIGDEYFSYHHRCTAASQNHIVASDILTIKQSAIPPHRYVNERKLFEQAKAATSEKFVLSRH